MIAEQRKYRRRPRSTNSSRLDIRTAIARRKERGESLAVRAILSEAGGSHKIILEELELAGVKAGERDGPGAARRREETLRKQLAEEKQLRVLAEAEAKVSREMYDEMVARIEFNLRKSEERARLSQGPTGGPPQIVEKTVLIRDEVSEAKVQRLMNENGLMSKRIEQLLGRLRRYEPDAE